MTDYPKGQIVAGLSGIDLDFDVLELGKGVRLQKTYAHLMAPYMIAFNPAPPGRHHPPPWKAAQGGFGYDITAELIVPETVEPAWWGDRLKLIRWVIALLRLWANPNVSAPVSSNLPFADAKVAKDNETMLIPHEVTPRGIQLQTPDGATVTVEQLSWVVENWESGEFLLGGSAPFHLAIEALDQVHFVRDRALAFVSIWAGIESLFSPAKAELRFRVSALLASYLESAGPDRRMLQKRLQKLYDARSSAAHGKGKHTTEALVESMQALRRALIKIISLCHVPTSDELDAMLFGEEIGE